MSYNVSALSTYTDDRSKEILTNIVAGSNTFATGFVRVEDKIKGGSSRNLHFFTNSLEYQLGACVTTPSGSTSFSEKNLSTVIFSVYDEQCPEDFYSKWKGQFLPSGSLIDYNEESAILDNITEIGKRDFAVAAWQGKYGTPANDMSSRIYGWLYRLVNTSYSGSTFKPSGSYTGFNSGNAIAIVDDLIANAPANLDGAALTLNMPRTAYTTLKIALRDSQAIAFNFSTDSSDTFSMPGYDNITVKRDDGLAGAKAIVLTHPNNLIIGTDMLNDADNIKAGYKDNTQSKIFFKMGLTLGTEIAFESNVGIYTY